MYGLLQELRIPVSLNGVSEELEKHPEYGTLLAISATLDHWHCCFTINSDCGVGVEITLVLEVMSIANAIAMGHVHSITVATTAIITVPKNN